MSRYLTRLAKLEAAAVTLPPVQIDERPQISLHQIIEKAKADAAFLEIATPLQRVVLHSDHTARLKATLAKAGEQADSALVATMHKVQRVWLPSFLENSRAEVRKAELDLLREAGFTSLDQPGDREHLELALFAA